MSFKNIRREDKGRMNPSTYISNTSKTQKEALQRMKRALDWYLRVEDIKQLESTKNGT
jgi:hypothetical protein